MTDPDRLSAALSGRYRIERELGEGGMATVYLAEDLKHQRQVAIKVLKPELAAVLGAERFVQEITTTAQLQHPNILALFDSGEADGLLYYVMPYVEGESLRDRLDREKQLGIDEAVRITTEVADALEYAHEHGVVHRDIKPENILLHAGRPMVADFGIALAVSAAAGGRMTETGLSLGTPHYMSPEQATAEKEITGRSDIYSLGAVLYELLTGDPPHTGKSAQQIIAKIVTDEPAPVTKVRKSVPPNVAAALGKALEKLPADRFETAKAFADALADPHFRHGPGGATGREAPGSSGVFRGAFAGVAVAAVVLLAAALWGWLRPSPAPAPPPMLLRLPVALADSLGTNVIESTRNYGRPSRTAFAFSPDGRILVYVGTGGRLMVHPLDGETSTPIPGVEHAESPFFSPDGSSIGYWADGHLRRVPVAGGPSTDIAAVGEVAGASWSEDGRIAVGVPGTGLILLSAAGATPPDTLADANAELPRFLPGGHGLLFTEITNLNTPFRSRIGWLPPKGGKPEILIREGADARYVPTGHLIFGRDGMMLAVRFDPARHTLLGKPFTVLPDVMQARNGVHQAVITGAMQVAVSPLGQLAWVTGGIGPDMRGEVVELDRQGHATVLTGAGQAPFNSLRLSPDGGRLALVGSGRRSTLEVSDLARGTAHTLPSPGWELWTLWSPDGRQVVASVGVSDSTYLVGIQADGAGRAEPLSRPWKIPRSVVGHLPTGPAFWSTDGSTLYAIRYPRGPLFAVRLSDGTVRPVTGLSPGAWYPTLSPDGRWLAYATQEPGDSVYNVYVQPWPALDRKWKVSRDGGEEPAWTRDGRELVYVQSTLLASRDSTSNYPIRMMAVDVGRGADPTPGVPHLLFTTRAYRTDLLPDFAVSPDGSRFYMIRDLPVHARPGHMYVMASWFTQLRRLSAEQEAAK